MERSSGILMPVFSLPNDFGMGSLGKCAFDFADAVRGAGCRYWQMLPVGPTGYGDSPYQSFSTFAGNPYLIDLEDLVGLGLLRREEIPRFASGAIDYGRQYRVKFALLRKAFSRAKFLSAEIDRFSAENGEWLPDYALYMSLKEDCGGSWRDWIAPVRDRSDPHMFIVQERYLWEMQFWTFVQYLFFRQMDALKAHCASIGLRLIGDLPIYVSMDSADVWANRGLFRFRGSAPTAVAGVPPDYFSPLGQLWGNPLYRWEVHRKTGYAWWIRRVRAQLRFFDVLRLDHFRGFAQYWSVPANASDARGGRWEPGGGERFLRALPAQGQYLAEDLGLITDDVRALRDRLGFPGMNVLQFAFDPSGQSVYLPHRHVRNSVTYLGTHDNDTTLGWLASIGAKEREFVRGYVGAPANASDREVLHGLMRAAFASVSDLVVLTVPDLLGHRKGRINTPASATGNWTWRLSDDSYRARLSALRDWNRWFGRD